MSRAPILIMAGGTGGHIYPALALADAFANVAQPVIWLGTQRGLEARVVVAANIPIEWISISGLRGNGLLRWLAAPIRLLYAVGQALMIMRRVRPRLVIGMGGFVAGPGGVAARLTRTPLVIHEQNAVAGLTNRWLAKIAQRVLQGFDGAFGDRAGVITVGNPVRESIRALEPPAERFAARDGALRLLVIGGSQGARILNTTVPEALALLPRDARPEVRHQAGAATLETAQDAYTQASVRAEVTAFIDDMAEALGWADFVICRAGALTVAELISAGVGAILVPFPAAVDDHQTANAKALVAAGGGLLLRQDTLTPARLLDAMQTLGRSRATLAERAERAHALEQGDAVARVVDVCAELLGDADLRGMRA